MEQLGGSKGESRETERAGRGNGNTQKASDDLKWLGRDDEIIDYLCSIKISEEDLENRLGGLWFVPIPMEGPRTTTWTK
jgi:hypothetical protein